MSNLYLTLGLIGLIASLIVVSALNPIHRMGYLVLVFLIGAFLFELLDFYFLGLVYIIVYVGAIAILFLFIIMMVECNPQEENKKIVNSLPLTHNLGIFIKKNTFINEDNNKLTYILNLNTNKKIILSNNNPIVISTILKNFDNINDNKEIIKTSNVKNIQFITLFNNLSNNRYLDIIKNISMILIIALFCIMVFIFFIDINNNIYTYFYPIWAIEFMSMTDLETLGIMAYVAYPSALILIGLALWAVMIGIIAICSPRHNL